MNKPRKRFGQHFLTDFVIIDEIISAITPTQMQTVVEIGPGPGALTLPLLKKLGHLQAVELDRDLVPQLQKAAQGLGELKIYQADALTFDFHQCLTGTQKLKLVGNLPYNISTPLLFHLFTQIDCIGDMVFMLQKEVVDRIAAKPGNKKYGRLSVMVQYFCQAENLFDVPPEAFEPPPKVMSAVVRLIPHTEKPVVAKDEDRFAELVRLAFNQRRKTIHNSLKGFINDEQFAAAGVDAKLRPENLSVADFVALSNVSYNA